MEQSTTIQLQQQGLKNFSVVLISVQPNTDTIGLKYLHGYLLKNNIDSKILYLPNYNEAMNDEIERFFSENNFSLVGLTAMTEEYTMIKKLGSLIKSKFNVTTIMGGFEATIEPEKCLEFVDYVIKGEAEDVLVEICNKIKYGQSLDDVDSLAYRKNGTIIKNRLRLPEENLDKYPFHKHSPPNCYIYDDNQIKLMDKKLFKKHSRYQGKSYNLITSRGCNFKCTFCVESFIAKMYDEEKLVVPKIRSRSVDHVIAELKEVKKEFPDLIYINIHDDNFFGHTTEWIKEFSEKFKKEIHIPIIIRVIPIFATEEKLKLLKDCGLCWVMTGMQTGSEKVQKEVYQRHISNDQFIKCTETINKLKLAPFYDVILDSDFETEEDLVQTIETLLRIKKPYQLNLCSLTYFPGTVIYDIANERGLLNNQDPYSKNMQGYKPTYLNNIVRITPCVPTKFIKHLTQKRNTRTGRILLKIAYYPTVLILEPINYLYLVLVSFNYNFINTFLLAKSFLKHYLKKALLLEGNH